jgi:hypothetical protein
MPLEPDRRVVVWTRWTGKRVESVVCIMLVPKSASERPLIQHEASEGLVSHSASHSSAVVDLLYNELNHDVYSSSSSSSLLSTRSVSLGRTSGNQPNFAISIVYCPIASSRTSTPSLRRASAWWLAALGPLCALSTRQQRIGVVSETNLGLMPPLELITRCHGTLPRPPPLWYVGFGLLGLVDGDGRCLRQTPTCL